MDKNKLYKRSGIFLTVFLAVIFAGFILQLYIVFVCDKQPVSISSATESDRVEVLLPESTGNTQKWSTVLQLSQDEEDLAVFTGEIRNLNVENLLPYSIKEWTLKVDIKNECYLNKFWCGSLEIHQFRDGSEITEVVDSNTFDRTLSKLEQNTFTTETMIRLMPGDYIVYLPSKPLEEDVITSGNYVGIGIIFYYEDDVDLSDNTITYYNDRKVTDGDLFHALMTALGIWGILLVIYIISVYTYRTTKREVESLSQSVINGLSMEYKTLWLINAQKRSIRIIRNLDEEDVNQAVKIASEFEDYDTSMQYYIGHYVDEHDREGLWNEINFDSLMKHLDENRFYSVYFLHHPDGETGTYFQMVFTRTEVENGSGDIILAYRDADAFVKKEQLHKKELEEALTRAEDANRAKSTFLANMSHEIRTPINAILGMDTMVLRETNEDNIREYAGNIKNAGNTLLSLINDILDFSKIESGKMEIVPVNYRLDTVIKDLIRMITPKADEKELIFEYKINPDIPSGLVGDEVRVKQIILNLLSNAVKYTKKGTITWTVDMNRNDGRSCELYVSVRDTGIGIKKEDIDRLFSPYERLDGKNNRNIEGTGLGLSIALNLLERMESTLQVDSVYGEGSDFHFALSQPVWDSTPVGGDLTINEASDEERAESFHAPDADILIVDDVEMNLMVINSLLKRTRIKPRTCLSGTEALELAKVHRYDLIFLDAMMPVLSGEETLALIKKDAPLNKDTPVVVLTANAIVGAREEYIACGFDDYLSKPVNGSELEEMIRRFLPDEKILPAVGDDAGGAEGEEAGDGTRAYLGEIEKIPEIDVSKGIEAAGNVDIFCNVCNNFHETAPDRIKMIRDYYNAGDVDNYAIQTHALKSSARLVGATELAELALEMEMAGKAKDCELIRKNTDKLLELYTCVSDKLKKAAEKSENLGASKAPKKELKDKKLKRMLSDLNEMTQAYDLESAKMIMESFREYDIPDSFKDTYEALKGHVAEVDYDGISGDISDYFEKH